MRPRLILGVCIRMGFAAVALALPVCACVSPPQPEFVTTADLDLRAGEEDDSAVVARLPRGTAVTPAGTVGGECMCWKVYSPEGTGWVYIRYLQPRASF
ncbi:MAG: SH3 domain-containing protein [Alphaproteobacteria bacterium]|nr:SH3 domain-containing protein [Alphaproteobacteria bacterium]